MVREEIAMTREEAIHFAECLKNNWTINFADMEDFCDAAIEALKAEPIRCGECENYIDRRCIEANHHVAAHGNCMNVFGAKRREL